MICNAFLRGYVAGYKYCVATDANSLILQLPNAVTCETGAIAPIYIAYGDARSDICRYFGYLDLISAGCKRDADSTSRRHECQCHRNKTMNKALCVECSHDQPPLLNVHQPFDSASRDSRRTSLFALLSNSLSYLEKDGTPTGVLDPLPPVVSVRYGGVGFNINVGDGCAKHSLRARGRSQTSRRTVLTLVRIAQSTHLDRC